MPDQTPIVDVMFLGSYDSRELARLAAKRLAKTMVREQRKLEREAQGNTVPRLSMRWRPVAGVWWVEMVKRAG